MTRSFNIILYGNNLYKALAAQVPKAYSLLVGERELVHSFDYDRLKVEPITQREDSQERLDQLLAMPGLTLKKNVAGTIDYAYDGTELKDLEAIFVNGQIYTHNGIDEKSLKRILADVHTIFALDRIKRMFMNPARH